ncbi:MAG TPA: hypothetical protein VHM19_11500 [Polyangiales bacterium]|jgi:hypothetical protein|nr:hypothetical protein [Polyangiales bacterium]
MGLLAFMFPRARRSEPRVVPVGTFGEAKVTAPTPPVSDVAPKPRAAERISETSFAATWEHEDSNVYRLTLPPDAPEGEVFPNIEAALLAAADQVYRTPSQPELPPIADKHRKSQPG